MSGKSLEELTRAIEIPCKIIGNPGVMITSLSLDSRTIEPGSLFCCIDGARYKGSDFIDEALGHGCVAVLTGRELEIEIPQVIVEADLVRPVMARVASHFWDTPSKKIQIIGVTGTNGKTTLTKMLESIFSKAGVQISVMGTLSGQFTTPESLDLQRWLSQRVEMRDQIVAMEVSSHGIATNRVDCIEFDIAIFTNLSHDHLDFHKSMDEYFASKAALFSSRYSASALVNIDTAWGIRLKDSIDIPFQTYSIAEANDIDMTSQGTKFLLGSRKINLKLVGKHNVANAIGAYKAAKQLGLDDDAIVAGLEGLEKVDGRMERLEVGQDFEVFVDFAHTPDALKTLLDQVRYITPNGRLILVFGCGGMRDKAKRPEMGRIAYAGADTIIITSDNPRSESPHEIIEAIAAGAGNYESDRILKQANREWAIQHAIGLASSGDTVVIAGKGHETYQDFGDRVTTFDDRKVAIRAIAMKLAKGSDSLLSRWDKYQ